MVVSYTRLYHVFCDVVTLVWAARKRRRILAAVFYLVMAVSARAGSFGFPIMGEAVSMAARRAISPSVSWKSNRSKFSRMRSAWTDSGKPPAKAGG